MAEKEFGTYFIGYARSPRTIEQMLENMFVGRPPGNYDRLLDFSVAMTGNLFFVPSATFLDNVGGRPAARRQVPSDTPAACASAGTEARRFARHRFPQRRPRLMNNLHRELAPISDAAWSQIEEEASRTLKRYLAGRRVVDVQGPGGIALSAVGTGHLRNIAAPGEGIMARQRDVKPLVELRVPFELDRQQIDDVERGANDSDWQPAKDAARLLAFAEDRAIFEGYAAGGIGGIRQGTSNPIMTLPADVRAYPDAIAQALSQLRLVGRQRPLFGVAERRCLYRAERDQRPWLSGAASTSSAWSTAKIIWAPAIAGAFVLTTRGGDFGLHIGQDVSIGYLSHDDKTVRLYLQETFTFLLLTTEASVALNANKTKGKG